MAAEMEANRIGRVEERVDDLSEKTSELRGAYTHLTTKADIAELKSWTVWRLLLGAAIIQGIIAALVKYLP
ncbi:MAG: hypothetical protein OXH98_08785 [Caldilineaceae bacterium]|nr:hypothetical protein [Caldilineaceae bacterium]